MLDELRPRRAARYARADHVRDRPPRPRPPLRDRRRARSARELGWAPRETLRDRAAQDRALVPRQQRRGSSSVTSGAYRELDRPPTTATGATHEAQGHHPRRRLRHAALSGDAGRVQAAAAGLRQADDLLPAVDADAGRHPRHPAHLDARRTRRASSSCWATARDWGIELSLRRAAAARRASRRRSSSAASSSAATACAWSSATTSSTATASPSLLQRGRGARRRAPRCSPTRCAIPSATAWSSSTPTAARSRIEEKPRAAEVALRGDRPLLLRQPACVEIAADLKPSARGELEITDVNRAYLERGRARGRDAGPRHRLARHRHPRVAARGVAVHRDDRERQGLKIACPEEIAYRMGYIDAAQLARARPSRWRRAATASTCCASLDASETGRSDEGHAAPRIPDVLVARAEGVRRRARLLLRELERARLRAAPASTSTFVQDNHSRSRARRAARPALPDRAAQGKLVRVIAGEVFDVAVDLRRGSPTFGRWVGVELSAREPAQLWIPPGLRARLPGAVGDAPSSSTRPPTTTPRARAHAALERPGARHRLAARGRAARSPPRTRPARRSRRRMLPYASRRRDARRRSCVTGANGQVGCELARAAARRSATSIAADRAALDLADPDAIVARGARREPDADRQRRRPTPRSTAPRASASSPTRSTRARPGVLAEEAKRLGAVLVHYSTDYVFDGAARRPTSRPTPTEPAQRLRRDQARGRARDRRGRRRAPDPAHELGVRPARQQFPAHHARLAARARRAARRRRPGRRAELVAARSPRRRRASWRAGSRRSPARRALSPDGGGPDDLVRLRARDRRRRRGRAWCRSRPPSIRARAAACLAVLDNVSISLDLWLLLAGLARRAAALSRDFARRGPAAERHKSSAIIKNANKRLRGRIASKAVSADRTCTRRRPSSGRRSSARRSSP